MRYTPEQAAMLSRHAAERVQLMTAQVNERAEMEERHAAELKSVGIDVAPVPMVPQLPSQPPNR